VKRIALVSSLDHQAVQNQITTDKNLLDLLSTMEKVYSFVEAIQTDVTEKINVLEDVIKRIFTQTVECAIFIREYTDHGFAGDFFLKRLANDVEFIAQFPNI
jgi:hypothetical protein